MSEISCNSGGCCCGSGHEHGGTDNRLSLVILIVVFALTAAMVVGEFFGVLLPMPWLALVAMALYLPVAWPVWLDVWREARKGDFFNEFSLMAIATVGAFIIGKYSEAIAVMIFYRAGEMVQDKALLKARTSLRRLLDVRPESATVERDGRALSLPAREVAVGEEILVAPGERVALDGVLLGGEASFNAASLTGESRPLDISPGGEVLAGMINLEHAARIRVTREFADTTLSRILHLVNEAQERKSHLQNLIGRLAKIYTPIVVGIAAALAFLPWFFDPSYSVAVWGYRALFFLVLSCPCALLISIPLGYAGGIGLAARHGILLKGANYLDMLRRVDVAALDKTGTLTHGKFSIVGVEAAPGYSEEQVLEYAAALEAGSTHPVAQAIAAAVASPAAVEKLRESPGRGVQGTVRGHAVMAGRPEWLARSGVTGLPEASSLTDTLVAVAVDGAYAGVIRAADTMKPDATALLDGLKKRRIKAVLLSGDRTPVVADLAKKLGIEEFHAELLPEDKLDRLRDLQADGHRVVAVGDGVNDAPLLAAAEVGVAMGGLGSDAAVEIADVVIQDDRPSQLLTALEVSRRTGVIVWQNIWGALAIKAAVLVLGTFGMANLWEAVFADVGVALLAVLNSYRLQKTRLSEGPRGPARS